MEIHQLEATREIAANQPLNKRFLKVLSNANPVLAEDETLLLSYYKQIRNTWSSSAIKNLKDAKGLKLTNKLNRCKFAIAAAKLQLQFMSSGGEEQVTSATWKSNAFPVCGVPGDKAFSESLVETDSLSNSSFQADVLESEALQIAQKQIKLLESQLQQQQEQLEQAKNFSTFLLTHRILAPGLPLNGTENSPAMRVLGSPKTRTELDANYRELIKREHPDVSLYPEGVAIERFNYIRSLYRITRMNWEVLKPTAVISSEDLVARMNAELPYDPNSFWLT